MAMRSLCETMTFLIAVHWRLAWTLPGSTHGLCTDPINGLARRHQWGSRGFLFYFILYILFCTILGSMGFGYVFGATPAVKSASLPLKLPNFLEDVPIKEVAYPNLEPITFLWFSSTVHFFDDSFLHIFKRLFESFFFFLNSNDYLSSKKYKNITIKENHKRYAAPKLGVLPRLGRPTQNKVQFSSIHTAFFHVNYAHKTKCYNHKLADSTAGVAPNTYPKPVVVFGLQSNAWNKPIV